MIMPEKLSLSEFVSRRLHPVKLTTRLLTHDLEKAGDEETVQVDAAMLGSVINTIELFIEDYEKLIDKSPSQSKAAPAVERKFVGEDVSK